MFNDFVRLWQEPPEAILRYAKRWGVLYLDLEGTPCVKAYTVRYSSDDPSDRQELPRSEPIDAWIYFSRRAYAVLNIAASLKLVSPKQGKRASPSDWALLDSLDNKVGDQVFDDLWRRRGLLDLYALAGCPYSVAWDINQERRWLAREITLWLEIGRPGFAVNERSWELEVDYNSCLFAAIALQLALTVTGARNLFTCSGCGLPYVREKKAPKPSQGNYCLQCGPKAALREADRRRREKVSDARRLYANGESIVDIAVELKTKPTSVRRWLRKAK